MISQSLHVQQAIDARWEAWQQTEVSQHYLTSEGIEAGYTLLYVPHGLRSCFFDLVDLFQHRSRWEARFRTLHHQEDLRPSLAQGEDAWQAWQHWTRRLAAFHRRVNREYSGTAPEIPSAVRSLPPEA